MKNKKAMSGEPFDFTQGSEPVELRSRTIHFVGIGGAGMSALAHILLEKGEAVTGSDIKETHVIKRLRNKGATIYIGHNRKNVKNARLVVISSAISRSNPELRESRRRKIPIIARAVMLASLMEGSKKIIIAGTHGKTTTTSMISFLLESNGFDPTLAIGGELKVFGGNAKLGRGEYFVAEADESDGSFLKLYPDVGIVTNVEPEHLDYYKDIKEIKNAFISFLKNIRAGGAAIMCLDDENIADIVARSDVTSGRLAEDEPRRYITYGIKNKKADLQAKNILLGPWGSSVLILKNGIPLGILKLNVPGIHNILNAMAAIGTGLFLGIEFKKICNAMSKFKNVRRRFEVKGEIGGILVLDDYAHHPSEIRMTLNAAKGLKRKRMIVVFQPHRWTRTKFMGRELGVALSIADIIFVTKIYSAGEKPIRGVHPDIIVNAAKSLNRNAKFFEHPQDIISTLLGKLRRGDLLITLGAGDVYKMGEELLERLKQGKG